MTYQPPPQYPVGPQQPYYGAPQGYRPYPPKRKSVWPYVIIAVLGGFALLVSIGFAIRTSTSTDVKTASFDDPVRDGQFEFTVTSIEQNGARHLGSGLFSADAKGEYVIVHVHVKNTGTDQRGFTSTAQKLIDGRGRKYSADGGADLALEDNDSTDLNPGLSVDRQVAFDVPAGTVIQTVELHDSLFSGGVKVDVGQ